MALRSQRASSVLALAALAATSLAALPARAGATVTDAATAEALFEEAKSLMRDGNDADACPKLAESERLDPGTGTLLMLALCHERTGRTASAWAEYHEAEGRAQRERRADREELARRHVTELERRVVRVRVRVADDTAAVPGIDVRRDGERMAPATWLVPIPLDPGAHVFEVLLAGERRWSETVIVGDEPGDREVVVPRIAPPPGVVAPRPPRREPVASSAPIPRVDEHPWRLPAYGAGALAVAGIAVGAIFGLRAMEKSHEAQRLCPAYPCRSDAVDANETAKLSATISNVAFALGGAGAIATVTFAILDGGSARATTGAGSPARGSNPQIAGVALGWQGRW